MISNSSWRWCCCWTSWTTTRIKSAKSLDSPWTKHQAASHSRRPCVPTAHSFSSSSASSSKRHYPLVIVGGGPTGLFLASLLQRSGHNNWCLLDAQLPEQHWNHPQAHFLNTRTMELFKRYLPQVYDQVQQAMPPVHEWNRFQFSPTMMSNNKNKNTIMATVQHPVHVPLLAGVDANGVLLNVSNQDDNDDDDGGDVIRPMTVPDDAHRTMVPLSDCTVGHLGQHIFHKILYDHVQSHLVEESSALYFGSKVVEAQQDDDSGQWIITTDSGQEFTTPLVVAADGAKSTWREQRVGIAMNGQPVIQRLINVHFSLSQPPPGPDQLPPAMLYTVFSSKVLAMVVRHSPTDYVMQIPFFPPYQTLEADFGMTQVTEMVRAALGNETVQFQIHSIRPWTMGSLVAESYSQNNVYLVGDAAHVFPPAGGFGMNTGLQDALALAWRLHLLLVLKDGKSFNPANIYTRERQAVAHHNAALSVRNYTRVLGIMKSCYLDERNLPLLLSSLEASSKLGVPLSWQRATFQRLFRAALLPLAMLRDPSSPYSKLVTGKLRRVLQSGQGLPLSFPSNELGFSYSTLDDNGHVEKTSSSFESQTDWLEDSIAPFPQLQAGKLMPHIPCRRLSTRHSLNQPAVTTTRDLPAQLATPEQPWPFVLLRILECDEGRRANSEDAEGPVKSTDFQGQLLDDSLHVISVELWIGVGDVKEEDENMATDTFPVLVASRSDWDRHRFGDGSGKDLHEWVLIRPDGHVAGTFSKVLDRAHLLNKISRTIRHDCGGDPEPQQLL